MPVSGLVLSLCDDVAVRDTTLAMIEREPLITTGPCRANRLAIVLDTPSSEEDKRLWNWLNSLPGTILLEVAFVGHETHDGPPTAGAAGTSSADSITTLGSKENP